MHPDLAKKVATARRHAAAQQKEAAEAERVSAALSRVQGRRRERLLTTADILDTARALPADGAALIDGGRVARAYQVLALIREGCAKSGAHGFGHLGRATTTDGWSWLTGGRELAAGGWRGIGDGRPTPARADTARVEFMLAPRRRALAPDLAGVALDAALEAGEDGPVLDLLRREANPGA